MKRAFFMMILMLTGMVPGFAQNNYESEWKEVESYVNKGQPQSAMKIVDQIYLSSKTENNAPQFLKATLYRIKLQADYQEDFMEKAIGQVSAEIVSSPQPARQILESILAELYWRYYQGNRYMFMDRTTLSEPDPNDIKTWDLNTLVKTVAEHYRASLEDKDLLKKTALGMYDPIIEEQAGSKVYRPTLYDFLAHRALDFFASDEPGLTKPAKTFYIDDDKYFLPAKDFAALQLNSGDTDDFKLQSLTILQDLVRFHLDDKDPAALIDADLKRIKFVEENAVMPHRFDLFLDALKHVESTYSTYPNSTDASYEIALEYMRRGAQYNPFVSEDYRWDYKNAKETCEKAVNAFPGSDGATNCSILLDDIVKPVLSFKMHYANLPGVPFLASLDFQNISKTYFRIIAMDPEQDRELRQKQRNESLVASYRSIAPLKSWILDLPEEGDFQDHSAQVKIPGLPTGYYVLLASDNPEFSTDSKTVAYASFWITGISYIKESNQSEGQMEVLVLDRQKGTAIQGVDVRAYTREYDYQSRSYRNKLLNNYQTDATGKITIPAPASGSMTFYLEFSNGQDKFFTDNYFYLYPIPQAEKSRTTTYFFTDRSIYRPGQTVYFKGIVLERTGDKSDIKPGFASLVTFYDANGQKVSEQLLTTNDFGSFNGTFVAPTGGLTGMMAIRNESGSVSFSVEEYKRPKFRVDIDPLEGNYKLNEPVTLTGKAMSYAGNAVDQASVSYHIVRTARFPFWRDWWYWFPNVPETEIASGMTQTGPDGSFTVTFTAFPDLQVDPKFQPVFNYSITVDVTDMTGEVRSSQGMVSVGYESLRLNTDIPEQVNVKGTNRYKVSAKNLNGRPVAAEVDIAVYPLEGPSRLLRDRTWERPDAFVMTVEEFRKDFPNEIYANENDPDTWKKGKTLFSKQVSTKTDSLIILENLQQWEAGTYLMTLQATDAFGQKVEVKKYFTAYNPFDKVVPENKPFWKAVMKNSGEPGDTAVMIVGTKEKNVKMLYEISYGDHLVNREFLDLNQEKKMITIPIREEYRGNCFVNFVFIKENRSYHSDEQITVPYTDRQLKITTETFRDKLAPGQEEEWRIHISGMKGEKVASELLASMYDASLDAFQEHNWKFDLYQPRNMYSSWDIRSAFNDVPGQVARKYTVPEKSPATREYDRLNWFGFNYFGGSTGRWRGGKEMLMKSMDAMTNAPAEGQAENNVTGTIAVPPETIEPEPPVKKPEEVPVRRNFAETAFFFPSLMTDENGDVILKFTVPESLTAWKLMMLAYTKDLKTGQLEKEVVTQKDLMVMPNPPRFFREGDRVAFSAKVVSLANGPLQGQVTAEFFDALTNQPIDELLGNKTAQQSFSVEKGSSQVFNWQIRVPEGLEAIVCRVRAVSGSMADGEETVIPVLPNRMLVTETLPLPVNGKSTKEFSFDKLKASGKSSTIKSYRLTLEFTSNPAWYAVQALPYLSESQQESSESLFSRYYANTLATYIANSNPKIRQVFENWKNLTPDALLSNLEKNQELKAVLLSETPWVLEARNETERKQRIALLFDLNHMSDEQFAAMHQLQQMQAPNGGWPWFAGMPDNRYITQLIMTGIGKLYHLGVIDLKQNPAFTDMARRGYYFLDARIQDDYKNLKETDGVDMEANHLGAIQVQYLYSRSFVKDLWDINPASQEAFRYYLEQAKKYWLKQDKYVQAMIALSLYRYGVEGLPVDILNSLKENALYSEEMGLYWRDLAGYYWYQAPIERQAMMIEAFSEVTRDMGAVEQLKTWLLKQKQTQDWKTSRATADAVYALLLRGTDLLASTQPVEITVGGEKIDPLQLDGVEVEAGSGYFETSWQGSDIKPQMGEVSVTKNDAGVAWGALYWQYYENLDRITAAESPLHIEKELYIEKNTPTGPVLEKVDENTVLAIGNRVKVRVIIRTDRDLEFVHMKDMRAAAFEPVEALSGYRYQGGMGYYESIRDASVNFFFDYLRKGTYVFEYPLNVTQKGEFSNGITSIQCLYAPEFAAHSQGKRVKVE